MTLNTSFKLDMNKLHNQVRCFFFFFFGELIMGKMKFIKKVDILSYSVHNYCYEICHFK